MNNVGDFIRLASNMLQENIFVEAFAPFQKKLIPDVIVQAETRAMTFERLVNETHDTCIMFLSNVTGTGTDQLLSRFGVSPRDPRRFLWPALDLLDNILKIDDSHGEPYALRGCMYVIEAHINEDRAVLSKAKDDFRKAVQKGAKNYSDVADWERLEAKLL